MAEGAGKGKKLCKGCQKHVGVRTRVCECGFSFENAISTKEVLASTKATVSAVGLASRDYKKVIAETEASRPEIEVAQPVVAQRSHISNFGIVCTPAGEPPFKPSGYKKDWPDGPCSDEVVIEWADKIMNYGQGRFSYEAIIYWARYFWEISTLDFRRVRAVIINHFVKSGDE